jgi:RNA polymerase sigma factor (sigma-70 family)
MEASVIHAPAGRVPLTLGLLRLRSDEQLLALFRAGSDEAFGVLHDRYRQRLFAYVRQMLSACTRQDAEDVLQDVFVRAYGALRGDEREVNVRAWLYRVAHNRCVDHLRRPAPPAADVFQVSRKPLHDPIEEAQRREDLRRLVQDVGRLPEQQRSALLMREIDGMSYADLAVALEVTVPAVKSLLVRARMGLVEAVEAREADCGEIRDDLLRAYDRGVKASGRARKHMRSCSSCRDYRVALRGVRRSFAALSPVAAGPLAAIAKLAGVGAGGAGGAGAAAGGGGAAASTAAAGSFATVTACKVAAVVCTAALAGGAVEADNLTSHHRLPPKPAAPAAAPVAVHSSPAVVIPVHALPAPTHPKAAKPASKAKPAATPQPAAPAPADAAPDATDVQTDPAVVAAGGAVAPADPQPVSTTTPDTQPTDQPPAATPEPSPTPVDDSTGVAPVPTAQPAGDGGVEPPPTG